MPTVLLTIEAKDQASSALEQVRQSLASVGTGLKESASAADRVAASLRDLASAAERAGSALEQVGRLLVGMASSTDSMVGASDKAASALGRQADQAAALAEAYRKAIVAAGDLRAVTAAGMMGGGTDIAGPGTTKETGTRSAGGLDLGSTGRILLGGAIYQGGYMAASTLANSISTNAQFSALGGQTVASTTQNPADIATLEAYATKLAGSGTQPYDAQTILTGLYGFMSQGFTQAQAIAMNNTAVGLAQVGGMPDTTTSGTALLAMGNSFGWGSDMAKSSQSYANYLQSATNIGAYSLADMASALPKAGLAQLGRVGFNPAFALTAMAEGSFAGVSADETAQQLQALGRGINKPQASARRAAAVMGMDLSPEGITNAGGAEQWFETFKQHLSTVPREKQGEMLARIFPDQTAAGLVSEMFTSTGPRSMQAVYGQMGMGQAGKGSFATALAIESSTPGQQLLSSEAQLTQAFNNLTTQALPGLTAAAVLAANALAIVQNPADIGAAMDKLWSGANQTFNHFANPLDPAFLKMDLAKQEAGQDIATQQATDAAKTVGTTLATAHAAATAALTPWYGGQWRGGAGPGGVQVAPGATGRIDYRTLGPGGVGGPADAGTSYANVANQYLGTTGRGTTTADVTRFEGNFQIAMEQNKGRNTLESAYGLAVNAIKNDPAYTGQQKTLEIDKLTSALTAALGTNPNVPQRAAFSNTNPLMGGFAAGEGGTVARFGTGQDTQAQIIAHQQQQITALNRQINLLERLVALATPRPHAAAHPNLLAGTGVNRMIPR